MAQEYDTTMKDLVEIGPGDWLALDGRPRGPVRLIDADLATVSRAADKVMRVEGAAPYLFHQEFQSGHDAAELPGKLNARSALLEQRHNLPVRTVVVVLRPEANSPVLTGEYRRQLEGEESYRVFRYGVIRVWQLDPDVLLKGGPGTLPLAPIAAVSEGELPGVIAKLGERLEKPPLRKLAGSLWTAADILLGLRYPADMVQVLLQGVKAMRESTTYQAILEEGRQEGIRLGEIRQAQRMLLSLGQERFGAPSQKLRKRLERLEDLDRLQALARRMLHADSWENLLAEEPPQTPPKRKNGSRS